MSRLDRYGQSEIDKLQGLFKHESIYYIKAWYLRADTLLLYHKTK